MESKLLVGGKTIIDHTNEQQKMLELKRQEIAEQVCKKTIKSCFYCFSPHKTYFCVTFPFVIEV